MGKEYGKLGDHHHQDIIQLVLCNVGPYLRSITPELNWSIIGDDGLMGHILGTNGIYTSGEGTKKGSLYPDAMLIWADGYVLIEVGQYIPGKWSGPLIHISFDHIVSCINARSDIIYLIADEIECMLGYHQSLDTF